jgi:ribose-phosphate pyrophosphokinase
MPQDLRVFSGTANPAFTTTICKELTSLFFPNRKLYDAPASTSIKPGVITIKQFADDEIFVEVGENVRGTDCFIVQPTCAPTNDNLMQVMLIADALKRASAARTTAVIPYYGYARQDRKDRPRVPISAKVVATMLEGVGVDRLLTMDLHNGSIGGFFEIPVDNLYALPIFVDYVRKNYGTDNLAIVSPDAGGVTRARLMAMKLGVPLAIIDKYREAANTSEVMNVIGHVRGRKCLMVDDMVDTAGTLCKGAQALVDRGAIWVGAAATHGVLSYDDKAGMTAVEKIEKSPLEEVLFTDTIPITLQKSSPRIRTLSVAPIFASAIKAIHDDESISGLFV